MIAMAPSTTQQLLNPQSIANFLDFSFNYYLILVVGKLSNDITSKGISNNLNFEVQELTEIYTKSLNEEQLNFEWSLHPNDQEWGDESGVFAKNPENHSKMKNLSMEKSKFEGDNII